MKYIHELNRDHLDHDWPTDVISFVFEFNEEHGVVEGEIVASRDTAVRFVLASRMERGRTNCCSTSCMACCTWPAWMTSDPEGRRPKCAEQSATACWPSVCPGLNNIWIAGRCHRIVFRRIREYTYRQRSTPYRQPSRS